MEFAFSTWYSAKVRLPTVNDWDAEYNEIDTLRWPAMPDPFAVGYGRQSMWIWPQVRVRAMVQIDPPNAHGLGYLVFPYVLSVFDRQNRHILTAALERTDYRMLAQLTGLRIQKLRGTAKGYLSEVRVAVYRADGHEDLGLYDGTLNKESAIQFLVETVADELELWEEPIYRIVD